jgi:UDP-N-acetylmuramoyl-tripeptide--D-alanyl-D-alanine ligase
MKAALENFDKSKANKKIIILGDMFELGKTTESEHQNIADLAEKSNFDTIIFIGKNFFKVQSKKAIKFKELSLFTASFNKDNYENASLLIKGSRGMTLEKILELFN